MIRIAGKIQILKVLNPGFIAGIFFASNSRIIAAQLG
jgi:hypothetical protein